MFYLSTSLLLYSCDPAERSSLQELSRAGIKPSGRALLQAVSANEPSHVRWLLDLKVHTGQRDAAGRTPLRIAIEQNHPKTALMLLNAAADPNAPGPGQTNILGLAIEKGESAVVEELIKQGARADGLMPGGEKILPWLVKNDRLAFARSMLALGADPNLTDLQGNNLLHLATAAAHLDLAKTLISMGADAGAPDAQGQSSLALAMKNGWTGLLPELAAAGADPNLPGPAGETLLEKAVAARNTEIISALVRIGADPLLRPPGIDGITPLEAAIAGGDSSVITALVPPRSALDAPEWGKALWFAFSTGDLELARRLLKKGVLARQPGSEGLRITEAAARSGRITWMKMLLDYGHESGRSVYYASKNRDHLTARFLLDCGACPNVTLIPTWETPLAVSLREGDTRLATLLLQRGATANLRLPEKQKPLHLALVTGNHQLVRHLLSAGANPNEPISTPVCPTFIKHVPTKGMKWYLSRDRNITPLMLAADSGVIPSARHLLEAGAKANTYTRVNRTWPLNFASRRNDIAMMRLILGKDPERAERHIVLSLSEQRARLLDQDGNELFSSSVSSGRPGFDTRTGEFVITNKHRHHTSNLYDASMPFFQRLSCSDFGFHQGAIPGYPASHGCIRLPAENAKRLFALTEVGDRVTIVP